MESNQSPGTGWYRTIDRHALLELGRALYYIDTTSGTTGSPKSRYVSIGDDRLDLRMLRRTLQYAGIGSEDVLLVLDIGDLNLYSMLRKILPQQSVVFWGVRPPFEPVIAKALSEVQPTVVFAFGNIISRGAKPLERYQLRHGRLRSVLYTGEALQSAAAKLFQRIQLECFGIYSSIELGFIGAECHAHDGMHIWEDVFRVSLTRTRRARRRIFKRQESVVPHGVFAATTLLARAKPALQYSTGDAVWYTRQRCSCGSVLPRIKFDRRAHEVVSLYGAKVTFDEVYQVVYDEPDLTNFLQIRVSERSGVTTLTLIIPNESLARRKDRRQRLLLAMQSYPGLAFLCDHGVLKFECEFQPASYFDRRKLNKVVDARTR